jgi:hypothetical protein
MMATTLRQPQQVYFGMLPNLYAALQGQSSSSADYAGSGGWFLDTCVSTHMVMHPGISSCHLVHSDSAQVIVGNGAPLAVTHTGAMSFPTNNISLRLNIILVCPSLIKNLISISALTRDNPITIEFDASGFSIKNLQTAMVPL